MEASTPQPMRIHGKKQWRHRQTKKQGGGEKEGEGGMYGNLQRANGNLLCHSGTSNQGSVIT